MPQSFFFRGDRNHLKSFVNLDISLEMFLKRKRKDTSTFKMKRESFVYYSLTII